MNQSSDHNMLDIRLLQEEARWAGDISIRYMLYQMITAHNSYYTVEICTGMESEMAVIGKNNARAQRVFEIMVNETVTPCVLSEILRDVEACEEERRHCQNLCKI